jgi:hypothetical protein
MSMPLFGKPVWRSRPSNLPFSGQAEARFERGSEPPGLSSKGDRGGFLHRKRFRKKVTEKDERVRMMPQGPGIAILQ